MKAWIVKETGEVGFVEFDGYFLNSRGYLSRWTDQVKSMNKFPILSVTPLPTREEMEERYNTWVERGDGRLTMLGAFMACYDLLFGEQPTIEKIGWADDWF